MGPGLWGELLLLARGGSASSCWGCRGTGCITAAGPDAGKGDAVLRKLRVDLADVAMAMEAGDSEDAWYLDRESGSVVLVPLDLQGEDVLDPQYCAALPAWEQEWVSAAREIYLESTRYVRVPRESPRGEYELMLRFAESAPPPLRELLLVALDGPGAFGRFRRVLDRHPAQRGAWDRLLRDFATGRAREWLRDLGIDPQ